MREHHRLRCTEDLYTLLDGNYEKRYYGKTFWRELHKLDQEIEPGGIHLETFRQDNQKTIVSGDPEDRNFSNGDQTLVIRLKDKQTAVDGARMLWQLLRGSGVQFVAESREVNGETQYLIRSDIDKALWEKLCVLCIYRFDREVTDPGEKKKLQAECQATLDTYTKAIHYKGWQATKGIPAFCALMGLHGVLRDKKLYKPNSRRKEHELNDPHPRGQPYLFQDVIVHADVKPCGDIECVPYYFKYDQHRSALSLAEDDKPYWQLLIESCGGYPFEKKSAPSSRAIAAVGLGLGLYGLKNIGEDIMGLVGPLAAAGAATTALIVTYIDYRWRIVDTLANIRAESKKRHLEPAALLKEKVDKIKQESEPPIPPEIHAAYTREGGPYHHYPHSNAMEPDAFSAAAMNQLADCIRHSGLLSEESLTRLHTRFIHTVATHLGRG